MVGHGGLAELCKGVEERECSLNKTLYPPACGPGCGLAGCMFLLWVCFLL